MTGDPITTTLLIAGTGMSAMGSIQQAKAQQQAANFNAQVALNNAKSARETAAENARRERRAASKRLGTLRARPSGDVNLDLLEDSVMEEELNINSILHAGELQALGLEASAELDIARGRAARQAGFNKAASSLLMGAGKAAGGSGSLGSPDAGAITGQAVNGGPF